MNIDDLQPVTLVVTDGFEHLLVLSAMEMFEHAGLMAAHVDREPDELGRKEVVLLFHPLFKIMLGQIDDLARTHALREARFFVANMALKEIQKLKHN